MQLLPPMKSFGAEPHKGCKRDSLDAPEHPVLGEHRGEDGPGDAWQGTEDRHVTMLLLLSARSHRHPTVVPGNGRGELHAEPIEPRFRIGQLAIDE